MSSLPISSNALSLSVSRSTVLAIVISILAHTLVLSLPLPSSEQIVPEAVTIPLFVVASEKTAEKAHPQPSKAEPTQPDIRIPALAPRSLPRKIEPVPAAALDLAAPIQISPDKQTALDISPSRPSTNGNAPKKSLTESSAPSRKSSEPALAFGQNNGPRFARKVLPVYPGRARRLGKEGTVSFILTIDHRGRLRETEIIQEAGYGFEEAALKALRRSTFVPATQDGRPVASKTRLDVPFRLE